MCITVEFHTQTTQSRRVLARLEGSCSELPSPFDSAQRSLGFARRGVGPSQAAGHLGGADGQQNCMSDIKVRQHELIFLALSFLPIVAITLI
jgi:hypothetical protein